MGEATFVDCDTRNAQTLHQLQPQFSTDLIMVAAQRHFLMRKVIIRITCANCADCGLDLRKHECLVIIDIEQSLRRIRHPPDHLRRHLNGVAA